MGSLDSCSSPRTLFEFNHHGRRSEQAAIICQSHIQSIHTVAAPAGSVEWIQTRIAYIPWSGDGGQYLPI